MNFSGEVPVLRGEIEEPEASYGDMCQLSADSSSPFTILEEALRKDGDLALVTSILERSIIAAALRRHERRKDVYYGLKISRSTLDAKIRRYGLREMGRSC